MGCETRGPGQLKSRHRPSSLSPQWQIKQKALIPPLQSHGDTNPQSHVLKNGFFGTKVTWDTPSG